MLDRLDVPAAALELNAASLTQFDVRVKLQQSVGALEEPNTRTSPLEASPRKMPVS